MSEPVRRQTEPQDPSLEATSDSNPEESKYRRLSGW